MTDVVWEQHLHNEPRNELELKEEDERIAFEEHFALATSAAEKRALSRATFVPNSMESIYYDALCTLLEAEEAMEAGSTDGNERAWRLVDGSRDAIEATATTLRSQRCTRKEKRLRYRLYIIELELMRRLSKPSNQMETTSEKLASLMGHSFDDRPPRTVKQSTRVNHPTEWRESIEELIMTRIFRQLEEASEHEQTFMNSLRQVMPTHPHAQTLVFQEVYDKTRCAARKVSDQKRWWILKAFVKDYPLLDTSTPGYLDVIVEDMQRKHMLQQDFESCLAYSSLSFSMIEELVKKKPLLFDSNAKFALRALSLLLDSTQEEASDVGSWFDSYTRNHRLATCNVMMDHLRLYKPSVNALRLVVLHEKLSTLLMAAETQESPEMLSQICDCLLTYLAIPRRDCSFMDKKYVSKEPKDSFVSLVSGYEPRSSNVPLNQIASTLKMKCTDAKTDRALVESSLNLLWRLNTPGISDFEKHASKYLDDSFLKTQKATTMIRSGIGDVSQWMKDLPDEGKALMNDTTRDISFCSSNLKHFDVNDKLVLQVHVRNIKSLDVYVYQIKTVDYYVRMRREILGDMCLDGVLPRIHKSVDLSRLTSWHEATIPVSFADEDLPKRGVFIVEVSEKDISCRAILRKGYLRHLHEVTHRGHEFLVLDEAGGLLKDSKLTILSQKSNQPGREFHADDNDGRIVVPFREKDAQAEEKYSIIFEHNAFGSFIRDFEYQSAVFHLSADFHIDSEQLVAGSKATIFTRPTLSVGSDGHRIALDVLIDAKLEVEFFGGDAVASLKKRSYPFPTIKELLRDEISFDIPKDCSRIEVRLSGTVERGTPSNDTPGVPLRCDRMFNVQRVCDFAVTYTPHLTRTTDEAGQVNYVVLLRGHNGEAIPDTSVDVVCHHLYMSSKDEEKRTCQSNSQGAIYLGSLECVKRLCIRYPDSTGQEWKWDLIASDGKTWQPIYCEAGEDVELPIPTDISPSIIEKWHSLGYIQVFKEVPNSMGNIMENVSRASKLSLIRNENNGCCGLSLTPPKGGRFVVTIVPTLWKCFVFVASRSINLVSSPKKALITRDRLLWKWLPDPLLIREVKVQQNGTESCVNVSLQAPPSAILFVVVHRFLENTRDQFDTHGVARFIEQQYETMSRPNGNEYLKKRRVSDEFMYIVKRRKMIDDGLIPMGFLDLPPPSLLQKPFLERESDMEDIKLHEGEKVSGFRKNFGGTSHSRKSKKKSVVFHGAPTNLNSSVAHLQAGSASFLVPVGDRQQITIDLNQATSIASSSNMPPFEVSLFLIDDMDGRVVTAQAFASSATELSFKDVRLQTDDALSTSSHIIQVQSYESLYPDESTTLDSSHSSKFATFASMDAVMDLWGTLCTDMTLSEVSDGLRKWHGLTRAEKLQFYQKWMADDLHYFLFKRDPVFFNKHVLPYVLAKVNKSFIDHVLVGDRELLKEDYLQLSKFKKLSVIEKLLLADRLAPSEESKAICHQVLSELSNISNASRLSLSQMFESILGKGFEFSHGFRAVPFDSVLETIESQSAAPFEGFSMPGNSGGDMQFRSSRNQAFGMASMASFTPTSSAAPKAMSRGFGGGARRERCLPDSDEDDSSSDAAEDILNELDEDDDECIMMNRKNEVEKAFKVQPKVRLFQEQLFLSGTNPPLRGDNFFWRHYAKHILLKAEQTNVESSPFASPFFPEALTNITEGLLTLAVLEIPFDGADPSITALNDIGTKIQVQARNATVVFHQRLEAGAVDHRPNTEVIVQQVVHDGSADNVDVMLQDGELQTPDELIVQTTYHCTVRVNNVTSKVKRNLEILMQIPEGSIPLSSKCYYLKTEKFDLPAHESVTFNYKFYFPQTGAFSHYPAHVSTDGKVIAWATEDSTTTQYTVNAEKTIVNASSWSDVSARGSIEQVIQFLAERASLETVPLESVAWRCKDMAFYREMTKYLRGRMVYPSSIWKYAFVHLDRQGMKEAIELQDEVSYGAGVGLNTWFLKTLTSFTNERFDSTFAFKLSEFDPFHIPRAHPVVQVSVPDRPLQPTLGESFTVGYERHPSPMNSADQSGPQSTGEVETYRRIMNSDARKYYRGLCQRMGLFSLPRAEHLLALTYFMVLQRRIEVAIIVFDRLKRGPDATLIGANVAVDYLDSFLDLYRAQPPEAVPFEITRKNIKRYKSLPPGRWHSRFEALQATIKEYDSWKRAGDEWDQVDVVSHGHGEADITVKQQECTTNRLRLDVEVKGSAVELVSQHVGACTVSFYPIDVEMLFSRDPFGSFSESVGSKSSLLLVQPHHEEQVRIAASTPGSVCTSTIIIPGHLTSKQLMVHVREHVRQRSMSSVAPAMEVMRSCFHSTLQLRLRAQLGMLQVVSTSNAPVTSCYIKVYAKVRVNGSVSTKFYKDGYTNILGKFDYVSLVGTLLTQVEQFSILAIHSKHGACVQQTSPPVLATLDNDDRVNEY